MPTTTASTRSSFTAFNAGLQAALLASCPEHLARVNWDRAAILAHQRNALRALLAHAAEHSPFHARRLAGIDLDAVDPRDLSGLPVMTKNDLMGRFDDILSDRRITLGLVEATLAVTGAEPQPLFGEYLAFTSGGSSGRRGVFVFDRVGLGQFVGSVTRGLVARIHALGGPPPGGLPVAIVAASTSVHLTGFAAAASAGGGLPFRFLSVPVTRPVPEIVERLNAMQPAMLYGYPSMLGRLGGEQRAGRLHIAPTMVTCTSETLSTDLRSAIEQGFGAPIIDAFACTEGLIGATAPDGDVHTFAEDGCIVELVDAEHRPVPPGTPAAAALITHLDNRIQPLIRYELTDAFVAQPPAVEHGYLRARVHGRCDDVFRYGAVTIHPLVLRTALVQTPEVIEYQVHQTRRGVAVAAVAPAGLDRAAVATRLTTSLAQAGLANAHVSVEAVPQLGRDPRTGKLRRFVPLPAACSADQS